MTKKEILQTLHNTYDVIALLHRNIKNCTDINNEQKTDLIDSNYELEEIVRYMIEELESVIE